jgi:[ribosomal protein S18]-alanine N-acetyltransferase
LSFEIQPARLNDLIALDHLEKAVFKQDAWPVIDLFTIFLMPGTFHLKALADQRIIGFISAEENLFEKNATITTVGVDPDYRRMGVARALMKSIEERIHRGIIRLCVRISNQGAINLYEELGYHKKRTRQRYYADGEDAFEMEKIR